MRRLALEVWRGRGIWLRWHGRCRTEVVTAYLPSCARCTTRGVRCDRAWRWMLLDWLGLEVWGRAVTGFWVAHCASISRCGLHVNLPTRRIGGAKPTHRSLSDGGGHCTSGRRLPRRELFDTRRW